MILVVCPNPSVDIYWEMDTIKFGDLNRIKQQHKFPGGKGVHVAINIAELGENVTLLGIWGGSTGKWARAACEQKNVYCDGVYIAEDNRNCIAVLSKNESILHTEFLENGPQINNEIYKQFFDTYTTYLSKASHIVVSGSWPPGANIDPNGIFIDAANKNNIPVWIDCAGEALQQALSHHPFGIHINQQEAKDICPTGLQIEEFFLQFTTQLALTAGKEGLYLYDAKQVAHAVYKVDEVISTVGCGDALLAGIVTASARKFSYNDIAKMGAACGAANCMRFDIGMFYKKDVESFYNN